METLRRLLEKMAKMRVIGAFAAALACLAALAAVSGPGSTVKVELEAAKWGPPALMPRSMEEKRGASAASRVTTTKAGGGGEERHSSARRGGGVTVNVRESHNGGSAAPVNVFVLPSLPSLSAGGGKEGGGSKAAIEMVEALEKFAAGEDKGASSLAPSPLPSSSSSPSFHPSLVRRPPLSPAYAAKRHFRGRVSPLLIARAAEERAAARVERAREARAREDAKEEAQHDQEVRQRQVGEVATKPMGGRRL